MRVAKVSAAAGAFGAPLCNAPLSTTVGFTEIGPSLSALVAALHVAALRCVQLYVVWHSYTHSYTHTEKRRGSWRRGKGAQ